MKKIESSNCQEGRVSVIIPTYYRNDRLYSSLSSVERQSYDDIEVIVVDGTGEGHSHPVISKFRTQHSGLKIKYLEQNEDQGPHNARSEGATIATGEYIQFLDDDDELHSKKIEKQVKYLENNPCVGVVYCGLKREFGDFRMPDPKVEGDVLTNALRFDMGSCYNSTLLIRRHVVKQIIPLKNTHGADDIGMKIELAKIAKFGFINEPLVTMGEQDYNLGSSYAAVEGRYKIIEEYSSLYEQFPSEIRSYAVGRVHITYARQLMSDHIWSLKSIMAFFRGMYLCQWESKIVVEFLCSLGGRPVYQLASILWRNSKRFVM